MIILNGCRAQSPWQRRAALAGWPQMVLTPALALVLGCGPGPRLAVAEREAEVTLRGSLYRGGAVSVHDAPPGPFSGRARR